MITSLRTVSFCSLVSKETPASMALLSCSIVWWVLVALISPLALSIVSDVVMYRLRLVRGDGIAFYSLILVRFNKFWWSGEV